MRFAFLAFISLPALFAGDPALDRLKRAAEQAKELNGSPDLKGLPQLLRAEHAALQAWIEPRLPQGEAVTPGIVDAWNTRLEDELNKAGLRAAAEPTADADPIGWPGYGYPSVEFEWLAEFPNAVFVTQGCQRPLRRRRAHLHVRHPRSTAESSRCQPPCVSMRFDARASTLSSPSAEPESPASDNTADRAY
jgi:hypothetical protein